VKSPWIERQLTLAFVHLLKLVKQRRKVGSVAKERGDARRLEVFGGRHERFEAVRDRLERLLKRTRDSSDEFLREEREEERLRRRL
jgi:hypothetical protein